MNDAPNGAFINGVHMGVEGDIYELWKAYDLWIINLTGDAHPMHMHLVNFQFYKKRRFNKDQYTKDWANLNGGNPPYNTAVKALPLTDYFEDNPEEILTDPVQRVWRDIVLVDAGEASVLRIRFKYNTGFPFIQGVKEGRYVIHCHILEHEDNEMMRYFRVK